MRARNPLLLALLALPACGESVRRGDESAAGAAAGKTSSDGGSGGNAGNPDGGFAGLSPSGGTAGVFACDGNLAGYGDTWKAARPMIPFSFERGAGTDSADCRSKPCAGLARVDKQGGTFSMTFDDGGKLTWLGRDDSAVDPPAASSDDDVWVEYSVVMKSPCPVCGGYDDSSLRVLDAEQQTLLWLGQEGRTLEPLSPATLTEVMGVGATDVVVCQQEIGACTLATRTTAAHSLETDPPQLVPAGVPTQVSTPNGYFQVS